jgi:hypothetical protein
MMEESFPDRKNALIDNVPHKAQVPSTSAESTPAVLPITTLLDLFNWYRQNLCGREILDPRGCRVSFLDTDFVHLIKLTDKYGKEPKNRRMTVEQIQSGRITLNPRSYPNSPRAGTQLGAPDHRESDHHRAQLASHGPRHSR